MDYFQFQSIVSDGAMIGVIVLAIVFGLVSIAAVIVIVMLWKKLAKLQQQPHQQHEPRQQQKHLQREQEGIAYEMPEVCDHLFICTYTIIHIIIIYSERRVDNSVSWCIPP